jgi:hypothetical protein
MRYRNYMPTGAFAAIAIAAALSFATSSFAGTPSLGAGCGTGATIAGSDTAGKVTLGTGNTYCIITFATAYANAPACVAMNETNGGSHAVSAGVKTSTTQLMFDAGAPWSDGDTLAYICSSY